MRLLSDNLDGESDDGEDFAQCPFCRRHIGGLSEDVDDMDNVSASKDVASVECPNCKARIALVREHSYRLAKFAPPASLIRRDNSVTAYRGNGGAE